MTDDRIAKFVNVLADWSLGIEKGDVVFIDAYESAKPLAEEISRAAFLRGAVTNPYLVTEESEDCLIRNGSNEQIVEMYKQKARMARKSNKLILIESSEYPESREDIPANRLLFAEEAEESYYKAVWSKGKKAVITHFPTIGYASQLSLELPDYENLFYGMSLLDWQEESRKMQEIAGLFKGARRLRIEGDGTELALMIRRPLSIEDGKENMPGGEIYFDGIRGALARGVMSFDVPVVYDKRIENARIEFMNGKVTGASASTNGEYLRRLVLNTGFADEAGFGTNPYASTDVIRWAEKAYGTMHLGISNDHGTHIDLVNSMKNGRVLAYETRDRKGRTVIENGKFIA